MRRVIYYDWPDSQECMECSHSTMIPDGDCGAICNLNHNKTTETKCVMFMEITNIEQELNELKNDIG